MPDIPKQIGGSISCVSRKTHDTEKQLLSSAPEAPFFEMFEPSLVGLRSRKSFLFESWIPGQEIVFAKNDNYWGDKAKVDKVVFKINS